MSNHKNEQLLSFGYDLMTSKKRKKKNKVQMKEKKPGISIDLPELFHISKNNEYIYIYIGKQSITLRQIYCQGYKKL